MNLEFQWKITMERVIDFCVDRGLCVCNANFKHESLHKHNRVARSQDGIEIQ